MFKQNDCWAALRKIETGKFREGLPTHIKYFNLRPMYMTVKAEDPITKRKFISDILSIPADELYDEKGKFSDLA